jgi:RNA polymerase sigma-70 factor (ECF subfamily)
LTQNSTVSFSDFDLVLVAQGGDALAFAELIRRHEPACHKVALAILRHVEDAEDEVQNALWKAYRQLRQFQRQAQFSTWLTRIVVNQCLMRLRQTRRLGQLPAGRRNDRFLTYASTVTAMPDWELGREQVAAVVRREICRIPPLLRRVFFLRDVEQLPMSEVAQKLGISERAARSRLLRARRELRIRMVRHCGGRGPATLTNS